MDTNAPRAHRAFRSFEPASVNEFVTRGVNVSGITREQAQALAISFLPDDHGHTLSQWKEHRGGISSGCHCTWCGATFIVMYPHPERIMVDRNAFTILADRNYCSRLIKQS